MQQAREGLKPYGGKATLRGPRGWEMPRGPRKGSDYWLAP
jgi:hypothetical protein